MNFNGRYKRNLITRKSVLLINLTIIFIMKKKTIFFVFKKYLKKQWNFEIKSPKKLIG